MICQELYVVFRPRCHIQVKCYATVCTPRHHADRFLVPASFRFSAENTNQHKIDPLTEAWLYAWEGLLMFNIMAILLNQSIRLMVKKYTTPTSAPFKAICQDHAMPVEKINVK